MNQLELELHFYDKLLNRYDSEIKNLWQRSLFLGTFILAVFTAIGTLFSKYCSYENILENACPPDKLRILFSIGILSCFGSIFSVLWVFMARGSKAWQEIYEEKINNVYNKYFMIQLGNDFSTLGRINLKKKSIKCCSAGPYSCGRINVVIGYIFAFLFVAIFSYIFYECMNIIDSDHCCWLFKLVIAFFITLAALSIIRNKTKSVVIDQWFCLDDDGKYWL